MNTDILTMPSPELKKHAQDVRRDVNLVAQDVKNQASAGLEEIKTEANARLEDAKGSALDLYDSLKKFAVEHPAGVFSAGLIAGIILASRFRK
jgi:hypothetical protein